MSTWTEALRRAELVAVGAALARRGLIRAFEGNLSCRNGDGYVLVTPRGADKARLNGADMVSCRLGAPPPAAASSEVQAHLDTYRACPGHAALVHAHPAGVLALAGLGRAPSPPLLREGTALLPRLEVLPELEPGSRELARACALALQRAPAVLLKGHGVLCAGDDLWQALARVEAMELLAGIALARNGRGGRD